MLADKHRLKLDNDKQRLNNEKDGMLSKGLNPYVEFRKRKFDAQAKNLEKKMLQAVDHNKARLAVTLIEEESIARQEELQDLRNYVYFIVGFYVIIFILAI